MPELTGPNPTAPEHLMQPLCAVLDQIADALRLLDKAQYTTPQVGFDGCIGGHLRHTLDHITALVQGIETGTIDYDTRDRDTPVERDRDAALAAITPLQHALLNLQQTPDTPMQTRLMLTSEGHTIQVQTTFGREAAFVLSHTIHHNAMVGAMIKAMGLTPPATFGYAPSTLASLKDASVAR